MLTSSTLETPLSPHWAFVVQLREGTALTPEGLHGRIEHIDVEPGHLLYRPRGVPAAFLAHVLAPGAPPHTLS